MLLRRALPSLTSTVLLLLAATALHAADITPPSALVQDVVDSYHGVQVHDPYRWLEDVKKPQTRDWLLAQGRHAEAQLAALPVRAALQARITELANASGDQVRALVRVPGGLTFYLKRKSGESQFNLVVRQGLGGAERVLVDAVALTKSTGVPHAVNYFVPSWNGRQVAYGVSAGGSEDASLHVLDLASGEALIDPVPRVHEGSLVSWTPDGRGLVYNQLQPEVAGRPETERYMDTSVFLLRPLRKGAQPLPVFGPKINPELKLDRLDVAGIQFDPAGRYMVARTTDTTVPEGKLFVAPVAALGGKVAWKQISSFDDKITDAQLHRDTLYLSTYAGAPRGRILALELARPELARAKVAVAEPETGVLVGSVIGRNALYVEQRSGFSVRLLRHPLKGGGAGVDVAPGLQGSAYPVTDLAHAYDDVYFVTSTWTDPARVLRSLAGGRFEDTGLRDARRPPGAPELEVSEVVVPSHDGAPVPLAIVHRKGLVLDGKNPTLLNGYGAYGFSMEARYDLASLAWIERGGVMAYANVRGSSAYGDAWYRAGFKATKPNTWKDGIACAQYLIDKKYASPQTLGVWGTSAGGIFVGRAVTAAPQLFAAAVFDVGMMDTLRAESSANGVTNISEFGTVTKPDEFRALLEMSTYHQIKDGTAYPAVLLVHGMNDPRVDIWQSGKAAARLQAASTSGKPVLLRVDEQAGHGIGSTAQQAFSQRADIYSFLLWQFGKLPQAQP
jgi:prolyl oligopeptidase